ncbi:MAG: tRNA (adenosine(37)-N6)-threonylcarbamoyltransferase complex transferase subunit TsaD [Candidatus Amoebophilus sp.]
MQQKNINILAIESSCDETAAAVICNGKIASNVIASQSIHEIYGGVVPELASRAHQQKIVPIVSQALKSANLTKEALHAVAFTRGPGLLGALLIGACFAKSLALGLDIPLVAVHHMHAHVLANFIEDPQPTFPFLCLTISGGHTQLVLVNSYTSMQLIGQTQDDAVGEAFDKIAKIMNFSYPGGPFIDHYAQQGDPHRFDFPTTIMPGLDFSFSGIKTAFLYFIRNNIQKNSNFIDDYQADICASIQHTLIKMLLSKVKKAMAYTGLNKLALAGGVAANKGLRQAINQMAAEKGWQLFIPATEYCTDNAAMIAMAAHYQYLVNDFANVKTNVLPNMPI